MRTRKIYFASFQRCWYLPPPPPPNWDCNYKWILHQILERSLRTYIFLVVIISLLSMEIVIIRWLLQWDTHNINTTGLPIMKPHKTIDSRYVRHYGENSGVSISEDEVLYCWWGQILFSNQDGHVDIIKLGDPLGNMIMDSLTIHISSWYYLGVIFHYRWSEEVQYSLIII